jgi:hypothetical protein
MGVGAIAVAHTAVLVLGSRPSSVFCVGCVFKEQAPRAHTQTQIKTVAFASQTLVLSLGSSLSQVLQTEGARARAQPTTHNRAMAAALTAHRTSGALSRAAPARRSFANAFSRPARRQLRPVAVLDVNQDNFEAEVLKVICVVEPHAPACSALRRRMCRASITPSRGAWTRARGVAAGVEPAAARMHRAGGVCAQLCELVARARIAWRARLLGHHLQFALSCARLGRHRAGAKRSGGREKTSPHTLAQLSFSHLTTTQQH